MAALTALLARDRVVSPQKIDEAIQRQVIDGGDLETNLLEIDVVNEDVLTSYCAALYEAKPATRRMFMQAEPEAVARATRTLAVQWQLVPLSLHDGKLLLAMVSPPKEREQQELERALGGPIEVRIATPFRVAWGLWKHYGLELAPRLRRLAQRLDARASGWMPAMPATPTPSIPVPAVQAPNPERPRVLAALAALSAALDDDEEEPSGELPAPSEPAPAAPPPAPEASPPEPARLAEPPPPPPAEPPAPEPAAPAETPPALAEAAPPAELAAAPEPAPGETPSPSPEPTALAPEPAPSAAPEEPPAPPPPAPRALLSVDEATSRLASSSDRDGLVRTLLDACEGRVRYAALFVAHGDFAEGHEARGDGPTAEDLRATTASMETGSLRALREKRTAVTASLRAQPADRTLFLALKRPQDTSLLLLPVLVSGRVVLVVALDGGPEGLAPEHLDEVQRLCGLVGLGLERLILERKRKRIGEAMPQRAAAEPSASPQPIVLPSLATVAAPSNTVVLPTLPAQRASQVPPEPPAPPAAQPPQPAPEVVALEPLAPEPALVEPPAPATVVLEPAAAPPEPERAPEPPPAREKRTSEAPPRGPRRPPSAPSIEDALASVVAPAPPAPRNPAAEAPKKRPGTLEETSTRFARGGRVPISVDVVGPLPSPVVAPGEPTRAANARRQSSRPPPPHPAPRATATATGPTGLPVQGSVLEEALRLTQELVRTNTLTDAMAQRLLGYGERALPALFRFFPGPAHFDRSLLGVRLPLASECGPLLRMVVLFRSAAVPHLVEVVRSGQSDSRTYAILSLGETVHPAALPSLREQLYNPDANARALTIEVLKQYRRLPEFDQHLAELRSEVLDSQLASERRRLAARALGELRDQAAPPALMAAMADADGMLSNSAHRALVQLTRQDFGNDLDAWQTWWHRARGQHRVQWLIDALLHDDAAMRHEASEELKKLSGQFFGFYFNLPRREREKAWRRYHEWWEREGAQRFSR